MGRTIQIEKDNKTYKLEFNRRTLLEASEVCKQELKPYEQVVELVKLGLTKNHPAITKDEVIELIDEIDDLQGFIEAIKVVMEDSVNSLKEKKGNAHWEVK